MRQWGRTRPYSWPMALFKRSRPAPATPPLAADAITIYLGDRSRTFETSEGIRITIDGYEPYLDEARTIPLEENQHGLAADRIVYSRIVGGTHHPELNNAVFDLGSKDGLVGLVHETANPHDPNAMAVCGVANKTIYTAGHLPRALAAVVAPLVGPGGAANAGVIATVSREGKRIGLRIVATVGRDMVLTSARQ